MKYFAGIFLGVLCLLLFPNCKSVSPAGSSCGFTPDENGFIKNWLVIGPFPNKGKWPVCRGYFRDFLESEGGEANIEPYPRMSPNVVLGPSKISAVPLDYSWKPFEFKSAMPCDFKELKFPAEEYVIGYAACYVEMPEEKKSKLKLGSDDGFKVWVNHKLIGEAHEHRAAEADQNVYKVALHKGINLLLVKLEQDWSGWELILRLTEMDDTPYADYKIYYSSPKYEAAEKIPNLKKINMLDKDIAGFLSWKDKEDNKERDVIFPGEINGSLELSSCNIIHADISLTICNERKEKIFSKEMTLDIAPNKSSTIPISLNVPRPGVYDFSAGVKDKHTGAEAGNLTGKIRVLDPDEIYKDSMMSKNTIQDLKDVILQKDWEIKNKNRIIEGKEGCLEAEDLKAQGWGGMRVSMQETSEGPVFISETVNREKEWGGCQLSSKYWSSPLVRLTQGAWDFSFEINAIKPDVSETAAEGQELEIQELEIKVHTVEDPDSNIASIIKITLDCDPATWQKFCIPLEIPGPLNIRNVDFQSWGPNPKKGLKIRRVHFQKHINDTPYVNYKIYYSGAKDKTAGKTVKQGDILDENAANCSNGFTPDKDGFIKNWLIVGPFPNERKWPACQEGFSKDFLESEGGEANIEPYPGMCSKAVFAPSEMPPVPPDYSWELFEFKSAKLCDFKELKFPLEEYVIGYAACYVEMPEKKDLKLKIGSDDGFKVWVNHEFIGGAHEHRGTKEDQNVYKVSLNKGINLLLIKLEQACSGWELIVRLTEISDSPHIK